MQRGRGRQTGRWKERWVYAWVWGAMDDREMDVYVFLCIVISIPLTKKESIMI